MLSSNSLVLRDLCVDDSETTLLLRKIILQAAWLFSAHSNYYSECTEESFNLDKICLVVADPHLKGESGLELAAQIKLLNKDVPMV